MTDPANGSAADNDRRRGPSRLSTWSGRRVGMLWVLWPAIVGVTCAIAIVLSVRVQGDLSEVRFDLTRSNLIGMAMVILVPPAGLTILWWRMRARRHAALGREGRGLFESTL